MALHPFWAGPCPRLRLGHSAPNLSIVRRLMRLTRWFCPHILALCRCDTLVAPLILWFGSWNTQLVFAVPVTGMVRWANSLGTAIDAGATVLQQFGASKIGRRSDMSEES